MKKQLNRLTSLSLIVMLLLALLPTAFAADWESNWSADYVRTALDNGWIQADKKGEIPVGETISRADFAVILWRMLGSPQASGEAPFTDVPANAKDAIDSLYEMGAIVSINDTTFDPDGTLSRQEAITMIAKILLLETSDYSSVSGFSDWASVADWAKPAWLAWSQPNLCRAGATTHCRRTPTLRWAKPVQ